MEQLPGTVRPLKCTQGTELRGDNNKHRVLQLLAQLAKGSPVTNLGWELEVIETEVPGNPLLEKAPGKRFWYVSVKIGDEEFSIVVPYSEVSIFRKSK